MKNRLLNTDFSALVSTNPLASFTEAVDTEIVSKWFVTQTKGSGSTSSTISVARKPFTFPLPTNSTKAHVPSDRPVNYLSVTTSAVGSDTTGSGYILRLEGRTNASELRGRTASFTFWAKATVPCTTAIVIRRNHGVGGSADFVYGAWKLRLSTTWQKYGVSLPIGDIPSTSTVGAGSFLGFGIYIETDTVTIKPAGTFGIVGTVGEIDFAMPQWEAGSATSYEPNNNLGGVGAGSARASGTLTFTGVAANGETCVLGATTYTFKTALTGAANEVLVGASEALSIVNLRDAINGLSSALGVTVGLGTVPNASAAATAATGTTLVTTALNAGTAGNSIASTETLANASWGAATLAGGTAATLDY
jgi:hypothetical protein